VLTSSHALFSGDRTLFGVHVFIPYSDIDTIGLNHKVLCIYSKTSEHNPTGVIVSAVGKLLKTNM